MPRGQITWRSPQYRFTAWARLRLPTWASRLHSAHTDGDRTWQVRTASIADFPTACRPSHSLRYAPIVESDVGGPHARLYLDFGARSRRSSIWHGDFVDSGEQRQSEKHQRGTCKH